MSSTNAQREQLEKLVSEMRSFTDQCDAKGELSGEDRERLTRYGSEVSAAVASIKASQTAGTSMEDAQAFLLDLASSKSSDALPPSTPEIHSSGIVTPGPRMTVGEAFVKSPAYQDFVSAYRGPDGRIREIANIKSAAFEIPGYRGKLVTGLSDTTGGAFVTPLRLPGAVDLVGTRTLTVDDLCTHIPITTDVFEYVTVTGKTNNAAPVIEATSSADGATYGVPAVGGGYKAESAMTFAVINSPVETIAHLIPVTRRAAADAPQAMGMIDAFMRDGLGQAREQQILSGTGTSPQLRGILATVGINTVGSAGTDIDAVLDGIAAIRADHRSPTALIVHPNDWYSTGFLLAKDGQQHYLLGDPRATIDQLNSIWGLRVVVTDAMTEGTILIGDFSMAVVADRMQPTMYVTDSHKDWFGRNILAFLYEERLGFGVLDPEAFCTVTAV